MPVYTVADEVNNWRKSSRKRLAARRTLKEIEGVGEARVEKLTARQCCKPWPERRRHEDLVSQKNAQNTKRPRPVGALVIALALSVLLSAIVFAWKWKRIGQLNGGDCPRRTTCGWPIVRKAAKGKEARLSGVS